MKQSFQYHHFTNRIDNIWYNVLRSTNFRLLWSTRITEQFSMLCFVSAVRRNFCYLISINRPNPVCYSISIRKTSEENRFFLALLSSFCFEYVVAILAHVKMTITQKPKEILTFSYSVASSHESSGWKNFLWGKPSNSDIMGHHI